MNKNELIEKAHSLPRSPGVYLMKDGGGNIIYVGKAKILPNRVSSYFLPSKSHSERIRSMVEKIADFDFVVCETEFEALALECNFIKQYRPKYNILLKDDKAYPMIKVSINQPYPRLSLSRKAYSDGSIYFGPYSSSSAVHETIRLAQKTFGIATCNREFPKDIGRGRPCLNYHIKQCCGPCTGAVSEEDYRAVFDEILLFLQGDYQGALGLIEKSMQKAAEAQEFEKAARYRDRLFALKKLGERQKVISGDGVDQDVFGFFADEFGACIQIFNVRKGKLSDHEYFIFTGDEADDTGSFMSELVKRYYTIKSDFPERVLLSHMPADAKLLQDYLSALAGHRVEIRNPKRGPLKKLVDMAVENARQTKSHQGSRRQRQEEALNELMSASGMDNFPERIEAFDISNISGTQSVGGMVVFISGEPKKSEYRRYKIRTVDGSDDYASMREVLTRRLTRALNQAVGGENGELEGPLPDLILVDGGKGHVSAAKEVLRKLNIDLPVFGIVKDDTHKTRGLVTEEGEISLKEYKKAFSLIVKIQEEVHRYAIAYHRTLRGKRMKTLELEKIEGIGPVRARALMRHFKTIDAIRKASPEELIKAPGMTKTAARALSEYFGGLAKE